MSSAYTPLKSHIAGIYILCILRFAKNCTRENKDTAFDHKIAKFDTREKFRLYGMLRYSLPINVYNQSGVPCQSWLECQSSKWEVPVVGLSPTVGKNFLFCNSPFLHVSHSLTVIINEMKCDIHLANTGSKISTRPVAFATIFTTGRSKFGPAIAQMASTT